ncbi:MAG: glycine cleavage H-protein [Deltaproteobacteria bacterium]|nr:glycine cleavage H-protein [Deltaproteobacteria bacterium]
MSEGKCPFLEIKTVTFCKAFPVKMIPLDRALSAKGVCNTCSYTECSLYQERSRPKVAVEQVRGFRYRSDYHLHPKHLWVFPSGETHHRVKVGIDDFAQKLIGKIDRVSLPAEGTVVKENAITFLLHSGARTVRMVSPSSGIVAETNTRLASEPSLINRDPYQEGWIFSMEAQADGLKGLFHGNSIQQWLSWEVERLQRAFTTELGITATDGGEILVDIGSRLTDPQWEKVANLFIG